MPKQYEPENNDLALSVYIHSLVSGTKTVADQLEKGLQDHPDKEEFAVSREELAGIQFILEQNANLLGKVFLENQELIDRIKKLAKRFGIEF